MTEKWGPLPPDHPAVLSDLRCPACDASFLAGDYVTLVVLGPGDDPEARERARRGRPYNAVGSLVHWACATGEE